MWKMSGAEKELDICKLAVFIALVMKKGKLISVLRRTAAGAFITLNLNPVARKITIIEE